VTRLVVVSNPVSGHADRDRLDGIATRLGSLGEVVVCQPSTVDGFDQEVRRAALDATVVVVAGGDGTMNRVVNALEARLSDLVLALVPMGTGNDLARTLGLPLDPIEAMAAIEGGGIHPIDYGRATGGAVRRLFVNACMGGFPVAVDEAIEPGTKRRLGPAAFWIGGARAALELERTRVRLDGIEVADCVAAGVGNGKTAGGGIEVWPGAAPDDGLLNGCALGAPNRAAAAVLAAKVRRGAHERLEGVATRVASRIEITSDPPIEMNVDGELVGLVTPATFEVAGSLRMCF
jgi:diacylglycerol kinase (ATP)